MTTTKIQERERRRIEREMKKESYGMYIYNLYWKKIVGFTLVLIMVMCVGAYVDFYEERGTLEDCLKNAWIDCGLPEDSNCWTTTVHQFYLGRCTIVPKRVGECYVDSSNECYDEFGYVGPYR